MMNNPSNAASTSAWGNQWQASSSAPAPVRTASSQIQRKAFVSPAQHAGKPLRKRDLVMIITQLSIMSRSGVDLADAISSLAGRAKRPDVQAALADVHAALQNGESFSSALSKRGGIFGEAMVAVIRAGEASGQMTEVLVRLSVLLRDEMRLHATIRSILSYPILLLVVTGGVLGAMIFFRAAAVCRSLQNHERTSAVVHANLA